MTTLSGIRTIRDLELENRKVFIRVDFNVPLDKSTNQIVDDSRIRAALPTIEYAISRGAKVILASHLGRPRGKPEPAFSLEPCGMRLAELLQVEVLLPDDCIGDSAKKVVSEMHGRQLVLLENLRFQSGETKNDDGFARQLASLCDCYVNDAFGAAHRKHASVHALPRLIHHKGCGLLMEQEIEKLGKMVTHPEKPFLAILGGVKVSDKIPVVESLLNHINCLCIGGAMANTFLRAKGIDTKNSLTEPARLALARTIMEKAKERNVEFVLPVDAVVATDANANEGTTVDVDRIPEGSMIFDIGPRTLSLIEDRCKKAKTVFWNGSVGLSENKAFATGTQGVAQAMADCSAFTIAAGGDTVASVGETATKLFTHVSTGGGAALEFVEGRKLPGIEILRSRVV